MKRPLSAPEIFIWAGGQLPRNFALAAHIRGHFSQAQLRSAIKKILEKDAQIGGRIIRDEAGRLWYETDHVSEPPIRIAQGNWIDEVAEELLRPFDTSTGPLMRFVMVQTEEYTDLIMVCHHCIADGLSAAYVLRDLFCYLVVPAAQVTPLVLLPPFEELLPSKPPANMQFPSMMPIPPAKRSLSLASANQLHVLSWAFTRAQTDAFVARCRREGTSVHAAICAAFLIAFTATNKGEPGTHSVSTPISLRSRLSLPVEEHFGLFIHPGIKTHLESTDGKDFWESAREIKASLNRAVKSEEFWNIFYFGQYLLRTMPLEQVLAFNELPVDYDLSVTNLGCLDFPEFDQPLRLEALYGPAVNSMEDDQVLGIATAGGQMTFTLVSHDRSLDFFTARQVKNVAMEQLVQAFTAIS